MDNNGITDNNSVLIEITLDEIANNFKEISENKIPIWRKNIENKMVTVPIEKVKQYIGETKDDIAGYKFQIEKNWQIRIKKNSETTTGIQPGRRTPLEKIQKYGKVEEQVKQFRKMTVVEREEALDNCIEKLSGFENTGAEFDLKLVTEMIEIAANTFYANNANIEESFSSENIQMNLYGVLVKTEWILKIIINIFKNNKNIYEECKILDEISTGSATINHLNKVFLYLIIFLIYYNNYIDEGLITKNIRGKFKEKYLKYYRIKMPGKALTVESIIMGGITRIDDEKQFQNYALGALLYDFGKISDILYHDGNAPCDENIVKRHVLNGYNMLNNAKKYPFEVLAMAAFHHEYYGGLKSYNFSLPLLSKFTGEKLTADSYRYFITYNEQEFKKGAAISFFPCKILEIFDIYDALTGKKSHTSKDALKIMKKEFIEESLKIDPILFRIFLDFKEKCCVINSNEIDEIES